MGLGRKPLGWTGFSGQVRIEKPLGWTGFSGQVRIEKPLGSREINPLADQNQQREMLPIRQYRKLVSLGPYFFT